MKTKTFLLGAFFYPLLELVYRRKTHASMALAGGLALCALRRIARLKRPLFARALLGGLTVTMLELALWVTVNRRHKIWDYRKMKGNLGGQICPQFAALWTLLSLPMTYKKRH